MGQRGVRTTMEERMEIAQRAQAGDTAPAIVAAMGRSVWTVRKWRRQYQAQEQDKQTPFLRQEGLVRPYERRQQLPQPEVGYPQHSHEVWEVDAQGAVNLASGHKVSIVNIVDVSRLKVESTPCWQVSYPSRLDYQMALRRSFLRHGLPRRVTLDHDTVFYDSASASPFPTPLHLWLIGLGREFLNARYPCRSLGHQPPLTALPEARHSGRPYRLELGRGDAGYVLGVRVPGPGPLDSAGQFARAVALGGQFYYLGPSFAGQQVRVIFDPQTQELVCCPERGPILLPIQGLTQADPMGELSHCERFPPTSWLFPFSYGRMATVRPGRGPDRRDFSKL